MQAAHRCPRTPDAGIGSACNAQAINGNMLQLTKPLAPGLFRR
jgi:hypothetical protein